MGRKKKIVEELFAPDYTSTPVEVKPEVKPDFKEYKYGTLVQDCSRCGHRQIMELGIEGGIQVLLPTTDKHHLIFECEKCKTVIMWHYIEAFEPGPRVKQTKENESIREENKEEQTV